jgi:hypothetical protein
MPRNTEWFCGVTFERLKVVKVVRDALLERRHVAILCGDRETRDLGDRQRRAGDRLVGEARV